MAVEHTLPRGLRLLLALGAALFIAYLVWTLFLRLLGVTSSQARAGVFLAVEERGTVNVTIDDKQQRAENGMMVFPGESVSTGPNARASLQFFDNSRLRLDAGTDLTITESSRSDKKSHIDVALKQGHVWLATAGVKSFSGSVAWTVTSPTLGFAIAPGTEAELTPTSVTVFTSDNDGVLVTLAGHEPFSISEGQQWLLPSNAQVGANVYDYRTPIDPLATQSAFVTESRTLLARNPSTTQTSSAGISGVVTITAPANGSLITTPTIVVQGTVGPGVTRVLINGYPALLDAIKRTYSQEVSPPETQGDFEIAVQAQDEARAILGEARRTVKRGAPAALEAPTITVPARAGETFNTQSEELILRGKSPARAAGIMVNDYKLQLFDPAKGEWSYVASLRLRNLFPGTNVYDIVAIDAAGKKGPAARLTIVQGGDGPNGVVSSGTSSAATSQDPAALPANAPLLPGSLQVTIPETGTSHTETGTGFLMIGSTSEKTASIWVNDYKLQLYRPGRPSWNYIVDVAINNLKRGKNVYTIVARDKASQILDMLTYTVQYEPR